MGDSELRVKPQSSVQLRMKDKNMSEQEWQSHAHTSEQADGKRAVEWVVETAMNGAELRPQDS